MSVRVFFELILILFEMVTYLLWKIEPIYKGFSSVDGFREDSIGYAINNQADADHVADVADVTSALAILGGGVA